MNIINYKAGVLYFKYKALTTLCFSPDNKYKNILSHYKNRNVFDGETYQPRRTTLTSLYYSLGITVLPVTGRWVCDDRFYGLVNRSNR